MKLPFCLFDSVINVKFPLEMKKKKVFRLKWKTKKTHRNEVFAQLIHHLFAQTQTANKRSVLLKSNKRFVREANFLPGNKQKTFVSRRTITKCKKLITKHNTSHFIIRWYNQRPFVQLVHFWVYATLFLFSPVNKISLPFFFLFTRVLTSSLLIYSHTWYTWKILKCSVFLRSILRSLGYGLLFVVFFVVVFIIIFNHVLRLSLQFICVFNLSVPLESQCGRVVTFQDS